jgi:hypothetical protein
MTSEDFTAEELKYAEDLAYVRRVLAPILGTDEPMPFEQRSAAIAALRRVFATGIELAGLNQGRTASTPAVQPPIENVHEPRTSGVVVFSTLYRPEVIRIDDRRVRVLPGPNWIGDYVASVDLETLSHAGHVKVYVSGQAVPEITADLESARNECLRRLGLPVPAKPLTPAEVAEGRALEKRVAEVKAKIGGPK